MDQSTSKKIISSGRMTPVAGGGEYDGEIANGRYEGKGTYILPTKASSKYVGTFQDGAFHGQGVLTVDGGKFVGEWNRGKMVSGKFIFEDGLEYKPMNDTEPWNYCSNSDPRFFIEREEKVPMAPTTSASRLKYERPSKETPFLPPGCYDTIDGYYDPKKFAIFSFEDATEVRMPDKKEVAWIVENCRYAPLDEEE